MESAARGAQAAGGTHTVRVPTCARQQAEKRAKIQAKNIYKISPALMAGGHARRGAPQRRTEQAAGAPARTAPCARTTRDDPARRRLMAGRQRERRRAHAYHDGL